MTLAAATASRCSRSWTRLALSGRRGRAARAGRRDCCVAGGHGAKVCPDRQHRDRRGRLRRRDRDRACRPGADAENALYSVISPEGCAAILWRDANEAPKAAALRPDARHCLELGVIDAIVPEPPGARTATTERRPMPPVARDALGLLEACPAMSCARRRSDSVRSGLHRGVRLAAPVPEARP
jgi:hypothetical protein